MGLALALILKTPQFSKPIFYEWEKPDFNPELDPFMKNFDEKEDDEHDDKEDDKDSLLLLALFSGCMGVFVEHKWFSLSMCVLRLL